MLNLTTTAWNWNQPLKTEMRKNDYTETKLQATKKPTGQQAKSKEEI